jgi:hypothetical protein
MKGKAPAKLAREFEHLLRKPHSQHRDLGVYTLKNNSR